METQPMQAFMVGPWPPQIPVMPTTQNAPWLSGAPMSPMAAPMQPMSPTPMSQFEPATAPTTRHRMNDMHPQAMMPVSTQTFPMMSFMEMDPMASQPMLVQAWLHISVSVASTDFEFSVGLGPQAYAENAHIVQPAETHYRRRRGTMSYEEADVAASSPPASRQRHRRPTFPGALDAGFGTRREAGVGGHAPRRSRRTRTHPGYRSFHVEEHRGAADVHGDIRVAHDHSEYVGVERDASVRSRRAVYQVAYDHSEFTGVRSDASGRGRRGDRHRPAFQPIGWGGFDDPVERTVPYDHIESAGVDSAASRRRWARGARSPMRAEPWSTVDPREENRLRIDEISAMFRQLLRENEELRAALSPQIRRLLRQLLREHADIRAAMNPRVQVFAENFVFGDDFFFDISGGDLDHNDDGLAPHVIDALTTLEVFSADVEEETPDFSVHSGYLSKGSLIHAETMSICQAKITASNLPTCVGFTFKGKPSALPTKIYFMSAWDIQGNGWTSYRCENLKVPCRQHPLRICSASESQTDCTLTCDRSYGRPLGISLEERDCSIASESLCDRPTRPFLCVTAVDDGLIKDWNEANHQAFHVRPGDFIMDVNNLNGDSQELSRTSWELMHSPVLRMRFLLNPPPGDAPNDRRTKATIELGDRVQALPGKVFEGYYSGGDEGTVTKLEGFDDEVDKLSRFQVAWDQSGKTSAMILEEWPLWFKIISKANKAEKCCNAQIKHEATDGCVICLAKYSNGEKLRILPCKHRFHEQCIGEWLRRKNQCPLCREGLSYRSKG